MSLPSGICSLTQILPKPKLSVALSRSPPASVSAVLPSIRSLFIDYILYWFTVAWGSHSTECYPRKKTTALLGNDGKKLLLPFLLNPWISICCCPIRSLPISLPLLLTLLLPIRVSIYNYWLVTKCTLRLVILRLYLYVILLHPKKRPSDQVV